MVFWRSAIALLISVAASVLPASAAATSDVLPPTCSAKLWQMRGPVRKYSPKNLYEYIDGNADLFLSYGFADAAVGDYAPDTGEGLPAGRLEGLPAGQLAGWISVDVYNMETPIQAFGIFGAEKPPDVKPASLATQSYESDGLIAFWKGRYYVKVSLVEGKDMAAAKALAQAAGKSIPAPAAMPAELQRLPAENRIAGSERYVRTGALGHAFLRQTLSAQYKLGDSVATLYTSDLRARGPAAAASRKLGLFYRRAGASMASAPPGLPRGAFALRDEFYGEMVVATSGKFMVIATSEKASRPQLADFAKAGIAAAGAVAKGTATAPPTTSPVNGPCPAASPEGH